MKSWVYKTSKWVHKYIGLFLLLFLTWMSISGVLLNHQELLEKYSLPGSIIPKSYHPKNWNRSTLKGIVYTKTIKNDSVLIYGNQGIFIASKEMIDIKPFMNGNFPKIARQKRTNHIYADYENNRLLAATNNGLFQCKSEHRNWEKIDLPCLNTPLKKIIKLQNQWVVVSASNLYISPNKENLKFERFTPKKKIINSNVSLVTIFFQLHDGSLWGLPGKLIWDLTGIVLLFLCISAFYSWYYPKKWKRNYKRKKKRAPNSQKRKRSFFFKYHKKLGWYFAIPLVVIFVTGTFLRPPLLISIAKGKINKKWYPAIENDNPWNKKIRNAFYDSINKQLILDCNDGIWAGELKQQFEKQKLPLRIFAMGATVFEEEKPGIWLIGSFGGLQRFHTKDKKIEKVSPQKALAKQDGRPSSLLVTSFLQLTDKREFVVGHYKGLCNLKGEPIPDAIAMPQFIKENYKMPLWNFLFELHNARIFRGWIGGFYILIIPLGGLLGFLVLISGVYDYLITRKKENND